MKRIVFPAIARSVFLTGVTALGLSAQIRLGIIGTDQPHGAEFARMLNDPKASDHVPGARVVVAYISSSPDNADSVKYVKETTDDLRKSGVEMVKDIPSLCGKVDGLLLESIDGRAHLEQAKAAIACGKPMFIDKPVASNLHDVREIARLANKAGVPWFSASVLRYSPAISALDVSHATGVVAWSPGPTEPHHQLELSWYAIHGVEILYTLLGPGCDSVAWLTAPDADIVVGRWKDGRIGSLRLLKSTGSYSKTTGTYGAIVFTPNEVLRTPASVFNGYRPLLVEIVKFFQSKTPPLSNKVTIETFAFMDAAQRSKATGGRLTALAH